MALSYWCGQGRVMWRLLIGPYRFADWDLIGCVGFGSEGSRQNGRGGAGILTGQWKRGGRSCRSSMEVAMQGSLEHGEGTVRLSEAWRKGWRR